MATKYLNMGAEPTLETSCRYVLNISKSVASQPEGSSPRSQEPATSPYPEQFESCSPPPNLSKIRSDAILPSTPRSSECSLSFGPSHQNRVHFSNLSHACHMLRPSHSPWFDLPNGIWGWIRNTKLLIALLLNSTKNISCTIKGQGFHLTQHTKWD
jgi:hypothetical protein